MGKMAAEFPAEGGWATPFFCFFRLPILVSCPLHLPALGRLGQNHRLGQADQRVAGHEEALLLGEGDRAVELGPAYVLDRLREQHGVAALEQLVDLPKEVGLAADYGRIRPMSFT